MALRCTGRKARTAVSRVAVAALVLLASVGSLADGVVSADNGGALGSWSATGTFHAYPTPLDYNRVSFYSDGKTVRGEATYGYARELVNLFTGEAYEFTYDVQIEMVTQYYTSNNTHFAGRARIHSVITGRVSPYTGDSWPDIDEYVDSGWTADIAGDKLVGGVSGWGYQFSLPMSGAQEGYNLTLQHWSPTTVPGSWPEPGIPGDLVATLTDKLGRAIADRQVFIYVERGSNLEEAMKFGYLIPDQALSGVGSINWDSCLKARTDAWGRVTTNYLTSSAIDTLRQTPGGERVSAFAETLARDGKIEGKVTAVLLDKNYVSGQGMAPPKSVVASASVPMTFTNVAVIREVRSRDDNEEAKVRVMSTDFRTGDPTGTKPVYPSSVPYDLKPGDVILLDRNDAIEIEWLSGTKWKIQTNAQVVGDKLTTVTIGFRDAGWYQWIKERITGKMAHGLNVGGGVLGHIVLGPYAWVKAVGQAAFAISWDWTGKYSEAVIIEPMSSILFDIGENATFYTVEGTARLHSLHNGGTVDVNTGHMMTVALDGSFGALSEFDEGDLDDDLASLLGPAPTANLEMPLIGGLVFESRRMPPGSEAQVPIVARSIAETVGNIDLRISYDPAVLEATEVVKGGLTADSLLEYHIQSGAVRISIADAEGFTGDGSLAYVRFRVVGAAGTSSHLTIEEAEANGADYEALSLLRQDGLFEVIRADSEAGGDCDGDGRLAAVDALCALQMAVGKKPEDLSMDVTGDGRVTSLDARNILRMSVKGP